MKILKAISFLLISALIIGCNPAFAKVIPNKTMTADIGTKRIPEGTIIKMKLLDPIDSDTMELGDQFDLMTTEDIKTDGVIIIPSGSMVRGLIHKISPSRILSKGAVVYLDFDHIVAPTGKQIPLKVGISSNLKLTYDGGLGSKTNYGTATIRNAHTTANIVKVSTRWGWETGDSVLSGYPKYALAPISAVASAPVAGMYFLGDSIVNIFKKGDDLQMKQGEELDIILLKPLDMPMY